MGLVRFFVQVCSIDGGRLYLCIMQIDFFIARPLNMSSILTEYTFVLQLFCFSICIGLGLMLGFLKVIILVS